MNYLEDLLGKDEQIQEEVDTALLQNNQRLNYKTQKLLERMQQNIDANAQGKVEEKVLQEVKAPNSLFSNNERLINQTNDMMSALENLFKPKEVIEEEVVAEEVAEVIEEDAVDVEDSQFDATDDSGNTNTPGEDLARQDDSGETDEDTDEV